MRNILSIFLLIMALHATAQDCSVAGFFPMKNQGRRVWNFNTGWQFSREKETDIVNLPHCVKLEPAEASGGRNYQGPAWYRKTFIAPDNHLTVYFEGAMGKQNVYVNGRLALKHYGGYLPFLVNLDAYNVRKGDSCTIAVMTDNSDDNLVPPGKRQIALDFAYHGGIYRDVWLIARNPVHISDVIEANRTAGGGLFVHYGDVNEKKAVVFVNTEVRNDLNRPKTITVEQTLIAPDGKAVKTFRTKATVAAQSQQTVEQCVTVSHPSLWSPEQPSLYRLETRIKEGSTTLDGGMTRLGLRSCEFRGKDGFWLNGRRYRQLIGANRHQDFAYVGNAVPNSQQWRDAKRLKDCGFNIIRAAHCPMDPAFMDACDELGLFVIVATPGWQYWNGEDTIFESRVLQNNREMIRRDRNHPSVLMWEPILNETHFPKSFALKALQITRDEYPYLGRPVAAADTRSAGVKDNYDVVYGWPGDEDKADAPRQCIFTREFGEYVDDWYGQNCLNRSSRSWGERPMLVQALSLAKTTEEMYQSHGQFIGGCQWHPFDHQRGYHPDPYWGGDYDAFRQPKTVQTFFAAQRAVSDGAQPMVHIAHEMTQFSDSDVVVFSNCDSVRLSIYDGAKSWTLPVRHQPQGCTLAKDDSPQFSAPVIFPKVWNFWEARSYSYNKKAWQKVKMTAEGIINGKVVCQEERMPSRRSTRLRLYADEEGKKLVADGSDFIVVVCEVTDDSGNVRRLAKENIRFTVTGEGRLIGDDAGINANPRAVEWGSAPALIQATRRAGKIHVHAEVQFPGVHAPSPADLDIESVPATGAFCEAAGQATTTTRQVSVKQTSAKSNISEKEKNLILKEVEDQQADFGISK